MAKLKEIIKKILVLPYVYKKLRKKYKTDQLKKKDAEQVFTDIFSNNAWGGKDSVSGRGSDLHQTRIVIKELPPLFREIGISTVLDIPCGDFHWMKSVDLAGIDYTGADIVDDLIENNTAQYGNDNVHFQKIDLIKDKLPKKDLVFCRDCLVHLSFDDIFCVFDNLSHSQSGYLLATTFPERTENQDIATGQWRVLNLELAPFNLPAPLRIINEGCTEDDGAYADKSLGLWSMADIQESLAASRR
jgi:2-polyprenyl-3-methyl-5-hydroxy-6-metoxy-1,4-benzoquinol methylase